MSYVYRKGCVRGVAYVKKNFEEKGKRQGWVYNLEKIKARCQIHIIIVLLEIPLNVLFGS